MSVVPNLLLVVPLLCGAQGPTIRVQMIDNGDFREAPASPDGSSPPRLPWWTIEGAPPEVVERTRSRYVEAYELLTGERW